MSDVTVDLVHLIVSAARSVEAANRTFIVGGAPRDALLGEDVKDIDLVVEDRTGTLAMELATRIARRVGLSNVHPDQYGVIHVGPFPRGTRGINDVDLGGQKVEIVTARREKYDKSRRTESHKPVSVEPGTIQEDLQRRDFTINTMMWRLADFPDARNFTSFRDIPIIDFHGGRQALELGILRTPMAARDTFEEDPSRMLRAVRFAAKYGFDYSIDVEAALREMQDELRRLPHEMLDAVLCKMLALPIAKMRQALSHLSTFAMLPICLQMIPETRLRRLVDGSQNIHVELMLDRFGFPSMMRSKLSPEHLRYLHEQEDRGVPRESLQAARDRFMKPPVDATRLMTEKGLQGPAVGQAISIARQLLLPDPFIDPEALHRAVIEALA